MKAIFKFYLLVILSVSFLVFDSCKSKKAIAKPEEVYAEPTVVVTKSEPTIVPKDTDGDGIIDEKDDCVDEKGLSSNNGCPELVEKVFNYKNIQFEYNSSVLKTSSYAVLDAIAQQMKKNPDAKFQLDGHSSAEGTEQRNMMLSVDRANAVKSYLVNNGIKNSNLLTKGYGESKPIEPNSSETNKALNRRVEIKQIN